MADFGLLENTLPVAPLKIIAKILVKKLMITS